MNGPGTGVVSLVIAMWHPGGSSIITLDKNPPIPGKYGPNS
jgi:hypothetical protein